MATKLSPLKGYRTQTLALLAIVTSAVLVMVGDLPAQEGIKYIVEAAMLYFLRSGIKSGSAQVEATVETKVDEVSSKVDQVVENTATPDSQ